MATAGGSAGGSGGAGQGYRPPTYPVPAPPGVGITNRSATMIPQAVVANPRKKITKERDDYAQSVFEIAQDKRRYQEECRENRVSFKQ